MLSSIWKLFHLSFGRSVLIISYHSAAHHICSKKSLISVDYIAEDLKIRWRFLFSWL